MSARKRPSPTSAKKTTSKRLKGPTPKGDEQKHALKSIMQNDITIIHGPAGTGKTYLSVLYGLVELSKGRFDKIILARPCVEAYGEHLGALPGTADEKVAPYMVPMIDVLRKAMPEKLITEAFDKGKIVAIPFAFMRGLTFENAYVVADEIQNTVPSQVELLLTRLGEGSKVVVSGDPTQSDIKGRNGLSDAIEVLANRERIGIVEMTEKSIVRSDIVKIVCEAYSQKKNGGKDPK